MLLILISGIALWIVYGVKREDMPIIATNSFSLLVNMVLMFFRFKYGNR
jgi:MtN3 and saliva related transmembrane protein